MRRNHNGHSLVEVPTRCGECGGMASLVDGTAAYPHRPDLADKRFYRCRCGAQVGCHPGTLEPLGPPASDRTRRARSRAHAHFDALYKEVGRRHPEGGSPRKRGYRWLSARLGIPVGECHIGMMDAATAERVVEICLPELRALGIGPERR